MAHLDREGVTFAEYEQWRLALEEGAFHDEDDTEPTNER